MEKIDSYIFYFNRICSIINNNKVIYADNTLERKSYDMTLSNGSVDILGLGKAHYCLSYCLIAENIHSKRVKQLIYDAFVNYTPGMNTHNINIEDYVNIKKIFSDFYPKLLYLSPEYKKERLSHLIRDNNKGKITKYLSHILTVLLTYSASETDRKIIIAYLPTVIMSFMINFTSVKVSKQYDQNTASDMAKKLTEPNNIIKFQNNNKADRNCEKSILAYAISVLYNCIMNCCTQLNFTLSFLWFERKIGTYQFYLTTREYMDIINKISCYEFPSPNAYIDISFPCLICKELLKNDPKVTVDTDELRYILDVDGNNIAYTSEIVKSEPLAYKPDFDIISQVMEAIGKREDFSEYINIDTPNSAKRFILCLTQFMYNHNLFYEDSTIKNKPVIEFKCHKIKTADFELTNARFTGWYTSDSIFSNLLSDFEYPRSFYNIYPTTDLINKKPAKLFKGIKRSLIKKYVHNHHVKVKLNRKIRVKYRYDVICKGVCILDNITADVISHKGKIIKGIIPNTLYNAKFQGLYINSMPNNIFSNNKFCKLFCKFNETNAIKPIVFLGINYYLGDDKPNIDKLVNNISKLYLSGAVFFSGHCIVPELHTYNELSAKLNKYAFEVSSSVSASCIHGTSNCITGSCSGSTNTIS